MTTHVLHGASSGAVGDDLGHRRGPLTDGAIDAEHILAALIHDRVDRQAPSFRLPVAQDELALSAADRNHGIDDFETSL